MAHFAALGSAPVIKRFDMTLSKVKARQKRFKFSNTQKYFIEVLRTESYEKSVSLNSFIRKARIKKKTGLQRQWSCYCLFVLHGKLALDVTKCFSDRRAVVWFLNSFNWYVMHFLVIQYFFFDDCLFSRHHSVGRSHWYFITIKTM